MNGVFGSKDLTGGVSQSIFVCSAEGGSVVTLNVCNRGSFTTYIDVAVSASMNSPLASEWIEYGVEILPKGVLERTGITVSQGQFVTVRSYRSNVSAMCWGVSTGSDVDVPTITANVITSTPAWNTTTILPDVVNGEGTDVVLQAYDLAPVTYSITSGSLPANLTLNSTTGSLDGSVQSTSYTPGGVASAFTVLASNGTNSASRIFNITKKWRDGLSQRTAGTSALSIKNLTGTTTDGAYWIQPVGCPEPFQLHCYMSIEGGGWMLVLRNISTELGPFGSNNFLVSDWSGWGFNTKSQIDGLGFNYSTATDSNCFTPIFAYSPFNDVMVIANRTGFQNKRVGWRHSSGFSNMYTVLSTSSEKVATSTLFGDPYRWLQQLDVRADTNAMGASGTIKVGFKIRSDTGSTTATNLYVGGFHTSAMHYGSMIGCGRDNSNANEWGGGFGGHYNGSGRYHRLNGHWWNHGDGRSSNAWNSGDQSSAFYGHAVYIR